MKLKLVAIVSIIIGLAISACDSKKSDDSPAKGPATSDNAGTDKTGDSVTPPSQGNAALIGSDLCKQVHCLPYLLTFREHEANGYMQEGGEAFNILKTANPSLLSAEWKDKKLYLFISLPEKQNRIEFEIEVPKKSNENDLGLTYTKSAVLALLNESESSDVHVYARESNTNGSSPRILVTASLISSEDKGVADAIKEINPAIVPKETRFGAQNFRGAHQEVLIFKQIPLSAFSNEEVAELKKWKKEKSFPSMFKLYFQNGRPGFLAEIYNRSAISFDEKADYCFLRVTNSQPTITDTVFQISATITLVSGSWSAGPFSQSPQDGKFIPAKDYSQSISLGIASAYEYIIPGKGFNKTGNGLYYNQYGRQERLDEVGCESKSASTMTVGTLQNAFGNAGITVYYPRQNKLEALLDYKMGLNPAEVKK